MLAQLATTVIHVSAEAAEAPAPLIAPPFVIGGSMFALLLVLLFVCLSFMSLGNRHEAVEEHADPHRQHTNKHDHGQAEPQGH
ncbi:MULTISPECIES: hypothetical protein [Arthrobacter]|uniref:Transmembrane protein n=2 Tax=Arthrobacter TaxID=1663 RepID=A0ABU9KH41_9MICC|nr:hypothetical protein [Arthrobacter sp. YJM1]MDP5225678.1 hypothetical protein [Arthrobacter sp. YJM1]